jgi:hypothetical protein
LALGERFCHIIWYFVDWFARSYGVFGARIIYAIEKSSSTLRNSGCRVESLLSDNSVDPKKPGAKGRISLE